MAEHKIFDELLNGGGARRHERLRYREWYFDDVTQAYSCVQYDEDDDLGYDGKPKRVEASRGPRETVPLGKVPSNVVALAKKKAAALAKTKP